MDNSTPCICKDGQFRKDCPYTFEQGGSRYHCLGGQLHALRVDSGSESSDSWEHDDDETGVEGLMNAVRHHNIFNQKALPPPIQPQQLEVRQNQKQVVENRPPQDLQQNRTDVNDAAHMFMQGNRANLRKFEALNLNGNSITDYSIGGFKIDIKRTEDAIRKISPLPPSALPKIFTDDDLNFYHHFFKGMESLLGKQSMEKIVTSKIHYEGVNNKLPNSICQFMESGMSAGDNALTMLVKKVLSSTFEKAIMNEDGKEIVVLRVASNLWGFRYIETNMFLKDADIGMWLSNCYNHYRTLWFDTFKSSGVPTFALEGVILNHSKASLVIHEPPKESPSPPVTVDNQYTRQLYTEGDDMIVPYHRKRRERRSEPKRSTTWFK